jgi:transcriptional regulator with XRE-family HTH domain
LCDERRPPVNAFCAVSTKETFGPSCDYRRMVKRHPIRPHLLAWRRKMDKSQEWLANELRTHHTSVLRWEKGTAGVDDGTFAEIARIYGITEAELSASPDEAGKARELHRLMTILPKMDEEGMRALATLAERLQPPK